MEGETCRSPPGRSSRMGHAGASRCCAPRMGSPARKTRFVSASSRHMFATRLTPDGLCCFPGGRAERPPPGDHLRESRRFLRVDWETIAMESTARLAVRNSPALSEAVVSPAQDLGRTLRVTATYLLSEEGRKASLLSGGDGKALQQLSISVPANRLHLVSVDANGVARLKLRPRYQLDGENGILRIVAAPTYDAPPDVEE